MKVHIVKVFLEASCSLSK